MAMVMGPSLSPSSERAAEIAVIRAPHENVGTSTVCLGSYKPLYTGIKGLSGVGGVHNHRDTLYSFLSGALSVFTPYISKPL